MKRRAPVRLRTRLRMFSVLIAAAVVAFGIVAYVLVTLPAWRLQRLTVTGNRVVPESQILAAAGIPLEANVWLLDTRGIARRIEAIPFVGQVRVRRRFPATVELGVTERVPSACVVGPDAALTIDAARRVLATTCLGSTLPRYRTAVAPQPTGTFLADPAIARLQQDAATLEAAGVGVRALGWDAFGSLDVTATNGLTIECGDDADLASKARLVDPILGATRQLRTVRAIDLRAPETPVVTYR